MTRHQKPPRVASRILDWLVPDHEFHTPAGDFEELYQEIASEYGVARARWWYRWQVVKLAPDRIHARLYWSIIMLKNYYLTTIRGLRKQKGFAFINVAGLATGIACFLIISLYVADKWSYDRFWSQSEQIYRMSIFEATPTSESTYPLSPQPLARTLVDEFPEVQAAARLGFPREYAVRWASETFSDNRLFRADSSIFEIFDLHFLRGTADNALREPSTVVLSDVAAERIFGSRDPMGETIEIMASEDTVFPFTVTGVVESVPSNSHIEFDFIYSWWRTGQEQRPGTSWLGYGVYTYFKLNPGSDPGAFEAKLPAMLAVHAGAELEQRRGISWEDHTGAGNLYEYNAVPITAIHLDSHTPWEIKPAGDRGAVSIFALTAIFILLMACVNYMNLSTARSAERAREIGMRKALGSRKSQLIAQMLTESTFMTGLAFVVGLLVVLVSAPLVESFTGANIGTEKLAQPVVWLGILGFILLVGLLAGSYPAHFLARLSPREILRGGATKGKRGSLLRNSLVVFQFVVSIGLIVSAIVVERQMEFVLNRDLGFSYTNTVVIENARVLGNSQQAFKEQVGSLPGVQVVARTAATPGSSFGELFMAPGNAPDEEQHNVYVTFSDHAYADALDLRFEAGRPFEVERATDSTGVVVNQALIRTMGIEGDPVGQELKFTGGADRYPIVGVVRDFNFQSLHSEIMPFAWFIDADPMSEMLVRLDANSSISTLAAVENVWESYVSSQPFSYSYLDASVAAMYANEQQVRKLFSAFSSLALLIACLGLFGLTAFTVERRRKEIGLRKALGASSSGVVRMLSTEFLRLAIIAFVLASPIAWFAMSRWLESFAYRIDMQVWMFGAAGLLAVLIAVCTVGLQSMKAARANPVDALRYD